MNFDMKLGKAAAVLFLALAMAGCGGGGTTTQPEPPEPTPYEQAVDAIAAATTAAAAQAAYDAVKGDVTAAEGDRLQAAVDARIAALAMMDRAAAQKMAIMTAAGNIDTSDLSTQAAIDAAEAAIAALEAALAAAADVSDADKAMYQGQVTAAETAVAMAQSALDHAAQTMALSSAVTALQAIDLSNLSTQAAIDAAEAAIAALRTALAAATELSDAEKAVAMTELAAASRIVMAAQGTVDTEGQKMVLADAADALGAIDLDNLMTQAQIDAAEAAIIALDLALEAATNLTDTEKLEATVDVTLAKRKVMAAKETLASNIGNQTDALMTAGMALAAIDLTDLSDQAKIDAAQAAVDALKTALDGATHLSDADKATYQSQLDTATETVRMAQTGMNSAERMMAQRTAIETAVDNARTAVAGVDDESTESEVSAADNAIAALKAAIEGAEDLPEGDADVASAQGTLTTLEGQLAAAKRSRMVAMEAKDKAAMEAMAKLGRQMRSALEGAAAGTNALANIDLTTPDTDLSNGLTIDAADNAGSFDTTPVTEIAAVTLEAGDSAGSLGDWEGTNYAHTNKGTKVVNEARVYINKGPGEKLSLVDADIAVHTGDTDTTDRKGYYTVDESADLAKIKADAFLHSGEQVHTKANARDDAVYLRGTFDGAPGEYRCVDVSATDRCRSTNDGKSSPSALGGVWHFKPDTGAMAFRPDSNYLYYGWWLSKDKDGVPTAASAFTGVNGAIGLSTDGTDSPQDLTGSATYSGHAVGKFAMSNALDGTGSAGHFTADATLTAKFGAIAAPNNGGISGTLDNFMANDKSVPWSVSLNRAPWGATGAFASLAANNDNTVAEATVWSIDGNTAGESGQWSGQMYDEMPGNPPDGDGSTVPTTVTGTFYSEFSSIGRMVGAFGADKQ